MRMKRIVFFLCIYAQTFGLLAMEPKPQIHHSRTRSISDPSCMNFRKAKPEGARPLSPQQKKLRQFTKIRDFQYTGQYKPVEQPKNESQT